MMSQITVVVPTYNNANTIEAAIKSLQNQSYKNLEIIVIDDGSTDSTGNICERISERDPRIKVIHQSNKGLSGARNTGIERASSDYICFVDGDDEVDELYVEELFKSYTEIGAELVVCGVQLIDKGKMTWLKKDNSVIELSHLSESEWYELFGLWIMNPAWNKLFKMDIIRENKIRFMEGLSCGEDGIFNFEYLKYCKKISFVEKGLYQYMIYRSNSPGRFWPIEGQIAMFEVKSSLLEVQCAENSEIIHRYQAKKALKNIHSRITYLAKKCVHDLKELEYCYQYYWKYVEPYIDDESVFGVEDWNWFSENKEAVLKKNVKTLYKKAKKKYAPSMKKRIGRSIRQYFD